MFDEIESLIKSSQLPSGTRTALAILTSAIRWFIWPFIGVGLLISKNFFPYWLGFFIFVESVLFLTLIYILVNISKHELSATNKKDVKNNLTTKNASLCKSIKEGIVGNLGFYLFLVIAFIVLKLAGVFDGLLNSASEFLK